jgi:twitching motility protein PilT
MVIDIHELLKIAIERGASDLHVVVGYSPSLRINRTMHQLTALPALTEKDTADLLYPLLSDAQRKRLDEELELDCSIQSRDGTRFRANFYFQRRTVAATFRHVANTIRTVDELKLPIIFHNFTKHQQGLILFTGPTGEGKSTSLAALVNEINTSSTKHIITIEDPIEYVFPISRSIISQRELDLDTKNWANALRAALRQDPDVILLGEMRDYDTISNALTAAETGHLVFSTLHTSSTSEAINRIVDVFPPHQQAQVRTQLASVLRVVVAQRLIPTTNEKEPLIPTVEVLQNTSAVAALVREGKAFMLDSILETSDEQGMILMEKYLAKLVREGVITKEVAIANASRPAVLAKYLGITL